MNPTRPSLSLVVPLHDEQDNIEPLLDRIEAALAAYAGNWELICVDDGSRDATWSRLSAAATAHGAHVRPLRLPRNFGQTSAMQAGIDRARGKLIATLDGDLQNDPADIPMMVDELQQRDLDLLCGLREHRRDHWLTRRLPSVIANRLIARVTGVRLHDYGCSLKLFRTDVIRQVRLYGEMHRLIPVWVAMVTAPSRIGEVVVRHHPRLHGESKYGLSRTFRVLLDLLTVFFFLKYQSRPGHFFGAIGLSLGAAGSAILAYLGALKFVFGADIGGRPLLLVGIVLVIFAMQFITTGVLAEMISRIFHQSRRVHAVESTRADTPDPQAAWRRPSSDLNSPDHRDD
ncbi:MAG: glycosyltransferase [Hydrocarboniphaga sp.]|uniref:glycosyltransferase family 2 protein n=1 Tax=Hydrocarboniphaga sp. TaxID=2033016 RepID=UPI00260D7224|nr:glycosyltransferase family 2 protein [Hydrocarboniphaga sp.]MDB5972761.1 glycosyltransferase [Hydrocarboniphaga sp.]